MHPLFQNYYRCPACQYAWSDVDSAQPDDDCPHCGHRHITPHNSESVSHDECRYHDALASEEQINSEEWIAATIFDRLHGEDPECLEERCQQLGRDILKSLLIYYRLDLIQVGEVSPGAVR